MRQNLKSIWRKNRGSNILERLALLFLLIDVALCEIPLVFDDGGRNIDEFESRVVATIEGFEERMPFEFDSTDTIRIAVAFSRSEFERLTHGTIPDWGIGAANPSRGEIVLFLREGSRSFEAAELVVHELGHIFLHRAVGDVHIPRWFDEGFAQWVTGPMDFHQSSRLSMAMMFGNTIPLSRLDDVNGWSADRAELAYAESRAAFDFLMSISQDKSPMRMIESIAEEGDFEVGFSSAYGMTIHQFYRIWASESARKFNWTLLLADWRITFSTITLLFVLFGSIKLIRMRIARKKAEDEED